ncbi:hypothetical protein [Ponticaulis sp.]|uniref:hypothetical protein n=1 Tax=Ponticaulis sp. TaxID=2020902 RepID=UPI000B641ABC|nr:hypothetical protein [Ponticaulis sp.]MAI89339.1 hypothetical protein [Ponticaulis sp.]OUY00927.1 MAG: hypothetical protein CBB65_02740 [Hyphomonadaceae bacterium TMED5]|tara:strand:+ start:10423 stop:11037 length:615 start_codon:yes stop_codon:yes gene_type:complete
MPLSKETQDKIVTAAFALAAEKPWKDITLAQIAGQAGVSMSDLYELGSKTTLLSEIDGWLDRACGAEPVDMEETPRERIFDIAMLRFEAMEDHREAIMSIREGWMRRPAARALAAKRRMKTAQWVLTCAGETNPMLFKARAAVLSGILFRAEQAWAKEEGEDFTRTMAQLDRDLRDVSGWAARLSDFPFRKKDKKEAAEKSAAC